MSMKKAIFTFIFLLLTVIVSAQTETAGSAAKQYLCILTLSEKYKDENNWDAETSRVVGLHFNRLKKNTEEGKVTLVGRTIYPEDDPNMFGMVIFYAANDDEANKFIQEDPAVQNNIMLAKVHPLNVILKSSK